MRYPIRPIGLRVSASLTLFISALLLPWPLFCMLAVAGIVLFPFYFEAVLAAFFVDALFGVPLFAFLPSGTILTASVAAFACIAELVKGNMRSYRGVPW